MSSCPAQERARRDNVQPFALASFLQQCVAMSFGIYLLGIVLLISGVIYAAVIVHAPLEWIIVGALVMLGVGVVTAVKSTRQRDPAE